MEQLQAHLRAYYERQAAKLLDLALYRAEASRQRSRYSKFPWHGRRKNCAHANGQCPRADRVEQSAGSL
jgi:hypothetical protein